jgi:hypothetical protein
MLVKEGDRQLARLGKARFAIPPGFNVIEHIPPSPGKTMSEEMLIMAKPETKFYTVIIFSMQRPLAGYEFLEVNLKKKFPGAFFYDKDLGYLRQAATYISRMPMARKLYLEDPVSKVFTGYQYDGSMNRYRFDIYQNFEGQNPYRKCCGVVPKNKDRLTYLKSVKDQKEKMKSFREFSLALIRDNVKWSFSVE